ncbi:MAG: aminotransferase class V-fold PLP-dependent enzyme, partial [Candidatus Krumholzibacteriota bacterium]|nr:aminotransferase class V-fold PLP-dependent enzyme [Candidatus Krumholzibacteriota bacterium]
MRTVYLDNNATTPVLPEVFEAMRGPLTEYYGNPSSGHRQGAKPAAALRQARKTIASFLGCAEGELVFTSCGTESNNIAILGALKGRPHLYGSPSPSSFTFSMISAGCSTGMPGRDAS